MPIAFTDILKARQRIAPYVRRTPLAESPVLSDRAGRPVTLKLEHYQTTGAFKLRGATNAVLALSEDERAAGVTAASTGNHGRALSHAARATGARAIICMSKLVPDNKVRAIKALGAEARIIGMSQDDAQVEVDRLVSEGGMTMIPPFDHADVIAGQGTIGIEILEDAPETGTVVVPLSGGGLIAGIARAVKTLSPDAKVIGVTMDKGAAMHEALKAGHPVPVTELPSLADSLGGGIGENNAHTFEMVRDLVDEALLVTEAEIAEGIRFAYTEHGEVIEGAAAVGIAALLAGKLQSTGDDGTGPLTLLLSGKNIDPDLHRRIINGENPDLEREAAHA